MRVAARVDANQAEIVWGLRAIGAAVQPLHTVGDGCPDLWVSYRGDMFAIEVKDGSKPPSKQALTPDQVRWHAEWKAPVYIVRNLEEAILLVASRKEPA